MEVVDGLLAPWHEGWHFAYDRYLSYPPELSADHDDTTVAGIIRCHMWAWLLNNETRMSGATFHLVGSTKQLKVMNFRDQAVIRFKKVDGHGRHANLLTEQQDDFDRQNPLPGLPREAVRLTCGYEPSPTGDGIRRVIVSRVYGKSVLWAAQVNMVGAVASWEEILPARFAGTIRVQEKTRRTG